MKRFRNVSAIVTLLAGFITAVVMIINRYSLVSFLWILIGVMVCFYKIILTQIDSCKIMQVMKKMFEL